MSDIPPELLEEFRELERRDAAVRHLVKWICASMVLMGLAILFSPCAHAASLDMTDVYCELFEPGADGRYYIAADPPYTPECPHPWVTLRVAKFKTLVDAYEGGGSSASAPLALSVEDGTELAWMVGGVWAIGWSTKQTVRALWRTFRVSDDA